MHEYASDYLPHSWLKYAIEEEEPAEFTDNLSDIAVLDDIECPCRDIFIALFLLIIIFVTCIDEVINDLNQFVINH